MRYLYMQDQCILNYRQLHWFFSPVEVLLNKEDFAVFALSQCAGKCSYWDFLCDLYCLALMRRRGQLDQATPEMLLCCNTLPVPKDVDRRERLLQNLQYFSTFDLTDKAMLRKKTAALVRAFCADTSCQLTAFKTVSAIFDITAKTGLDAAARTELLLMLWAAYGLANQTLATVPLTAADAQAAMLETLVTSKVARQLHENTWDHTHAPASASPEAGDSLPPAAESAPAQPDTPPGVQLNEKTILLAAREKAHELLLHPLVSDARGGHRLPEGCTLQTHCIKAAASPTGSSTDVVRLHFYRTRLDQTPIEYVLKPGECLHLNAVHTKDDAQPALALPPLPPAAQALAALGLEKHADIISSVAQLAGDCIMIVNGKLDATRCHRDADFIKMLKDHSSYGMRFVEAAFIRDHLYVLTDRGDVYTNEDGRGRKSAWNIAMLSTLAK